ncbi:MAG: epoxide hydrolase [Chloroflexota bacterium]|nr:epoxide hydrolase [Chloroflexota bacterium]
MIGATTITPFTIDIPQADLDDLRNRLGRTRFAQHLPGVGWRYGTPTTFLQELVAYWKDGYDWRMWEAKLNGYPQFMTGIDGQNIHFLHVESAEPNATPLVLLHGWPGSILEFLDTIEPLTNPVAHGGKAEDAFHLVIPSLPGFGFSGPTTDTGWESNRMARAIAELMARLRYERYGVQGGDAGQFVAADLGREDADQVIGIHLNAATYGFIPWGEPGEEELASLTESERARIAQLKWWTDEGSGYFNIQANRPQTIAAGLADSPVGQLAWIVDMFKEWTFKGKERDELQIDRDLVLTNVMFYWLTNTAASTARNYFENVHSGAWPTPVTVPTGVAVFARDIAIRRYGEEGYNIVHWSEFDRDGHFAALEAPDLLVGDIRAFFASVRNQD